MTVSFTPASLLLLTALAASSPLLAGEEDTRSAPPEAELLLFLAEFADVDEETFNLLVERGTQDSAQEHQTDVTTAERGTPDEQD